jgi:hypothetical protein
MEEPVALRAPLKEGKPTPGPWRKAEPALSDKMVLVGSNLDDSVEETKNGGMWIAQCLGPDRDANARLIAAAPEDAFGVAGRNRPLRTDRGSIRPWQGRRTASAF